MMKWILAILLFVSGTAIGQIGLRDDSTKYIRYWNQYGSRLPRFWADSAQHLPYFDTAIVKPQKAGAIMMHLDKNVYKWNGGGWEPIGGGGSSGSAGGDLTGTYPNPTIANNAVTDAKLRQSAAFSVIGNSSSSIANVADISAGFNDQVLRRSAGTLGFGAVNLASSNAVSGNLPVTNLNSGTSASSTTFWRGDGTWATPSGGGGIAYILSATAPTGTDTSKIWIQTPAKAGIYDVWTYVTTQFSWNRFGWLSIDGVFSTLRPYTIVTAGQSNAAGVGPGGDTSFLPGIIAFGSPSGDGTSTDYQYEWHQARINQSPFYSSNNNIAFQFAKQIVRHGTNRLVRILTTYEGGTSLDSWINGGNGHVLLDTLRVRLTRSGIDTIDAFLWHQGESGGVTGFTLGGYVVDQRVFYDTLCSPLTVGFKRNYTKYIAGGLGDAKDIATIYNVGSAEGGQRTLNWDGNLNTAWVPSWGLSDIGDGIHFTGTSIDSLAYRYYTEAQRLPHSLHEEKAEWNYDLTYDLNKAWAERLVPYNGGGSSIKYIDGISLAYNISSNGLLTIDGTSSSVALGTSLGYTNTVPKMFRVNGKAVISDGAYNVVVGGNWNITGDPQRNIVIGNYPSSFVGAAGGDDNVMIGHNVGYNGTRSLFNSTIIGSGAALNINPIGFGDNVVAIGKDALASGACLNCAFVGNSAGASAQGNALTGLGTNAGALNSTGRVNSTAIGANTKYNEDSVFVAGNALKRFIIGGTTSLPFLVGAPSNGQGFTWNTANGQFELTTPGGADGNGIYGGNGSLPSNVTVTGANNSLTFDDIFAFKINSDYNTIAKANGTGIYTEAVIGAPNTYEIGYTPVAGIFSKGAGVFIDTNNNVGMGANPPTTMPLYATGASTFIQGLQSNHGNFYKVSNITSDGTASLQAYFYTIDATAGNVTVTLPAASSAFGSTMGITYKFQRIDASGNTVTIQRAGSDTINGGTSFTLTTQWGVKIMQCSSASTWAQY